MSLTLLVGPSGVGKTVIWQQILNQKQVRPFKTHTSRSIREEEKVEGVETQYHFHSAEEFEELIRNDAFFEHVKYVNNYYGTVKADIEQALNDSMNWIGVVEIQGAKRIKSAYPDVKTIFITPPSDDVLLQRLINRNSEERKVVEERFENSRKELAQQNDLDYKVTNEDLQSAVNDVLKIIQPDIVNI